MARERDEALAWDGDDDPTLDVGADLPREAAEDPALPPGWHAVGKGSESVVDSDSEPDPGPDDDPEPTSAPESMSNASLISLGVLGGVFLLYGVGWLIGALRLQGRYQVLVTDAMYQGALWLATAAPLIWFGTVLFATRGSRPWVRFAWLGAGVLLLIPWPFIMIGVVGQ